MKKMIATVNGYDIIFDDRTDNTNTYPYSIKIGKRPKDEFVFRTEKQAIKWAENH